MQQQGQVVCSGCRVTLGYPLGAPSVQCPMCRTITATGQVQIRCVCCGIGLSLPSSAQLAQCPRCRTVMAMPRMPPMQHGGAAPAGPPPPPPQEVVCIENPPIKDASGRLQTDTAIGTKLDDD